MPSTANGPHRHPATPRLDPPRPACTILCSAPASATGRRRVVAFEPVRKFRALLDWSIHAAGVSHLVDVVRYAARGGGGVTFMVIEEGKA